MRALISTGANIVEIVPTWYQDTVSSTVMYADPVKTATDTGVREMIGLAHEAGLAVLLKPHVDVVEGEGDTWRGDIEPSSDDDWFSSYADFAVHYAQLAEEEDVEFFAVGTELKNLTGPSQVSQWDAVIDVVRGVYDGSLVYAANHDEYDSVAFWDRLDLVGVDAYFDLGGDVPGPQPTVEDLLSAWEPIVADFASWLASEYPAAKVMLTEIGYRSIPDAHVEPSDADRAGAYDGETQAICYEAALDAWGWLPWVEGMVFWTWPTDLSKDIPSDGGNTGYVPYGKPAEETFRAYALQAGGIRVLAPLADAVRDARDMSWGFSLEGVFAGPVDRSYSARIEPAGLALEVSGTTLTVSSTAHVAGMWSVSVRSADGWGREAEDEFLLVLSDDLGAGDRVVWDLAANRHGEVLVVWSDDVWSEDGGRFAHEVRCQRFGPDNGPLCPPTVVAMSDSQWFFDVHAELSDAGIYAVAGLVAPSPTAGPLVVWPFDSVPLLVPSTVWVQYFGDDDTPIGGRSTASGGETFRHSNVDIDMDSAGNAVVVWDQRGGSADNDVAGRAFGSQGRPTSQRVFLGVRDGDQREPSVALLGDGFVATWSEWVGVGPWQVVAQRFSLQGQLLGDKFDLFGIDYAERQAPLIVSSSGGSAAAAGRQITRLDALGYPVGPILELTDSVVILDMDPFGNVLANDRIYDAAGDLVGDIGNGWASARLTDGGEGVVLYDVEGQIAFRRWREAWEIRPGGTLVTGSGRPLEVPLAGPVASWRYVEPDGSQVTVTGLSIDGSAAATGSALSAGYPAMGRSKCCSGRTLT